MRFAEVPGGGKPPTNFAHICLNFDCCAAGTSITVPVPMPTSLPLWPRAEIETALAAPMGAGEGLLRSSAMPGSADPGSPVPETMDCIDPIDEADIGEI